MVLQSLFQQTALTVCSIECICSTDSAGVPNSHGNAHKLSAHWQGTKSGAAHRSPQTRGRGRGANSGQPSNADMALLQQQYDQAKSQLAISGAQLAQAQEKFQNIHI